jgi:hypothetical protein
MSEQKFRTNLATKGLGFGWYNDQFVTALCPTYLAEILPDENNNCSLCGKHSA